MLHAYIVLRFSVLLTDISVCRTRWFQVEFNVNALRVTNMPHMPLVQCLKLSVTTCFHLMIKCWLK